MHTLFLQAVGQETTSLVFMFAIMAVFVVMMVLPQRRQRRRQKEFMDALQKGDEVVTSNGMLGRVTKLEDQIVTLDMGNKTFIRFTRNAISRELTEAVYPPKKA